MIRKDSGRWRAFEGANGWYVAYEEDGCHHQPANQGSMTEREARYEIRRLDREERYDARRDVRS